MYYKKQRVYIKNNVLFDLRNMQTFKMDPNEVEIYDNLYNNKDNAQLVNYESYNEIKQLFFEHVNEMSKIEQEFDDVVNIQIKVSNMCNLKCTYCYAKQGNYGKEDSIMSLATAKKIAEKINELFPALQKISFFGGEPLLNLDGIEMIINTLKNKNIKYSMVTNGTILSEKLYSILEKYDMNLIVSVDGPKEIHDTYRINNSGNGSFDTVASNIHAIQKKANAVGMIAAVYTKPGFEKYSKIELYDFLYNMFKVKAIGIGDVITDVEGIEIPKEDRDNISPKETIEYTVDKIMKEEFFTINIVHDILASFFNNNASMSQFCGAGVLSLFIDEEGNVCPCQLFTDDKNYDMGNIIQEGRLPYTQTDSYSQVRNILKNVRKSSIAECEGCIAQFWCFRCIGQYKSEKNFGACKYIDECNRYVDFTMETLNILSEYINEGKFDELMRKMNNISHALRTNAFLENKSNLS